MAERLRAQYGDRTRWSSAAAYAVEYSRTAAPLVDHDDPLVVGLLAHDLEHGLRGGRSRQDLRTVVDDALDVFCTSAGERHFAAVTAPMRLLWAPWGVGPESEPMYSREQVRHCAERQPALQSVELVENVDHAAIVMTRPGAEACARVLERSLG
jgi:hypothetical protein